MHCRVKDQHDDFAQRLRITNSIESRNSFLFQYYLYVEEFFMIAAYFSKLEMHMLD